MVSEELNKGLEGITVAETKLSYIDGENGELIIGGFPIETFAQNSTYEESIYLLLNDQLPTADELSEFQAAFVSRRQIEPEVRALLRRCADEGLPAMDALRMGAAAANLGSADGTLRSDTLRMISVFPTIVATYWRYMQGQEPVHPREDLTHSENYLYMLTGEKPTEAEVRGFETYLNSVIDHGLNASTFTARAVVSTESDVTSAATAAVGSLKGPIHGGAPGPVLHMLNTVHESGDSEGYVREKLDSGERLMGFGHRVYRVRDPRAEVLSKAASRFYHSNDDSDFFKTVKQFESVAVDLLAEYYPDRTLDTNVEFYTAALLPGVGIPQELFSATFAVSRVGGWMAHCVEQLNDNRIIRPRAKYIGSTDRTWKPIEER